MEKYQFEDINKEELNALNLSKENLDEKTLKALLSGNMTEFVQLNDIQLNSNQSYNLDAKLQLKENSNKSLSILIHPIYNTVKIPQTISTEQADEIIKKGVAAIDVSAYGKLKDFGTAPYQDQETNSKSYFIEIEKNNGETKKIWGKELETALKSSNFSIGDNIQISHTGIENKSVLNVNSLKLTNPDGKTLFNFNNVEKNDILRNIELSASKNKALAFKVELNGKTLDVDNYTTEARKDLQKFIDGVGVKEKQVQLNTWEIKENQFDNAKDIQILYEYDKETKSFVGKDINKIIIPDRLNGLEVSESQKKKLLRGEQIEMEDGTDVKVSLTKDTPLLSNKQLLVGSVILDGGVSYVMYHTLKYLTSKLKENEIFQKEKLNAENYIEELQKIKKDLEQKAQKYPNSKEIREDLNILKTEISKVSNVHNIEIKEEHNISEVQSKVNDPELIKNVKKDISEEKDIDQSLKEQVKEEEIEIDENRSKGRGR